MVLPLIMLCPANR